MSTFREASHITTGKFVDPTPAPAEAAHPEVGATSAPLKSAAFFIGSYCKDYNEDFMLCKEENNDPAHCLKEGRKVTRCAMDLYVLYPKPRLEPIQPTRKARFSKSDQAMF